MTTSEETTDLPATSSASETRRFSMQHDSQGHVVVSAIRSTGIASAAGVLGGCLRRVSRRRGRQPISSAAWMLHFLGAMALCAGLLLPLTGSGEALTNSGSATQRWLSRAQDNDVVLGAPVQVVAIGDFQNQLGCSDFDATCGSTQLSGTDGLWTGIFPISPGTYSVQIAGFDSDGTQYTFGDDGLNGDSIDLKIDDSQTGAFFSYNAHTNEVVVEAVDAIATLESDSGSIALAPDNGNLVALVPSQGGDLGFQLVIDGQPAGGPQSVSLQSGWNRVTVDTDGNVTDVESLQYGTLTISRTDGNGQPLSGACFQVRNGDTIVNQGCDGDDGASDGSTLLTFPEGIDSGDFTLVETKGPDDGEQAEDQDISLQGGDNSVDVSTGGGDQPPVETPEDATQEATGEATQEGATQESRGEPGDLIVTLQDEGGEPIGGACFQLIQDGNPIAEACDTTDNFPNNGNVGFFGVPSGTYTLHQSTTPEGGNAVEDREIDVVAGQETTETVSATATTPENQTGDIVVLRQDDDGNAVGGACFEIVGGDGNVVAEETCDEDGDVPDDGRTGFFGVPVGSYTVRETRTPDQVEQAADQPVEVQAGTAVDVTMQSAVIATAEQTPEETPEATVGDQTPEAEPGDLIVTLRDDEGGPIGGACFQLIEDGTVVAESCDTNDSFPNNGNTGFFGVPSGTYTLHQSTAPQGTTAADDREVEIVAGEEQTETAGAGVDQPSETPVEASSPTAEPSPTEAATTEPTTETPPGTPTSAAGELGPPGSLIVTLQETDGQPVGDACFELVQETTVIATACDSDDPFPGNGRTGFFGVPSGTFTLRESQVPDGTTAIAELPVTIEPDAETEETVQSGAADVTSTVEPTQEGQPTPTAPTTETAGTGVTVDVTALGQSAGPICVELNTSGGIGLANPPSACDEGDGDSDETTGIIQLQDVPPGDYAIFVTSGPEPAIDATFPVVTVNDAGAASVALEMEAPTEVPTQEPTATPEPGAVEVAVVDPDGQPIVETGTCVTVDGVTDTVCDNESGDASGDPGVVLIEGIPAGTYTVSQSEAPEGYQSGDTSPEVTVATGEVAPIDLTLPSSGPTTGTIRISVLDSADAPVSGACFNVANDSGTFDFCDEDGDGVIEIPDVAFGLQTVTQTTASDGYAVDSTPQTPKVSAESPAADLNFRNDLNAGVLPVLAVDANGKALGGACWSLAGGANTLGPLCDDGANGGTASDGNVQFEDVPAGTYTLQETQPPAGNVAVADQEINVVAGDNQPVSIAHEAAPITLEVTTTAIEGGILTGACYVLDGSDPLCDSDGDGIINFENVAVGDHTVGQSTAPGSFEVAPEQTITIELGQTPKLTFTNDTAVTGSLVAVVTDNAGAPITGTCITVGDGAAVCDNDATDGDTGDGRIQVDELATGDYTVILSGLTEVYVQPEAKTVTVTADQTAEVNFGVTTAALATGSLQVLVQTDDETPVGGACVVLSQDGQVVFGPICDNGDGDSDPAEGVVAITEIDVGTYSVSLTEESTATIEGFQSAATRSVTITSTEPASVIIPVVIVSAPINGVVEIVTRDNVTSARVGGACYELRSGGDPIAFCDGGETDQNGTDGIIRLNDVPAADYMLVMTTTPTGYTQAAENTVTIQAGGINRIEVRIDALPDSGGLDVHKVDANGDPLGDSCFAVRQGGVTISTSCDSLDDDPNDGNIHFPDLPGGIYRLVETKTPSSDYQTAAALTFRIIAGQVTEVTVTNVPSPGRLVVTKVDLADATKRLDNACFALQGDREYGPFCDGDDQAVDGRTTFSNVVPDDYSLVETLPPSGYLVADARDITIEPGSSQQVTIADELAPPPAETGTLIVYKQDGARQALAGGCFRLFDGDSPVTGQICDNSDGTNDGTIQFNDVPVGTWTLREILAPSPSYQIAENRDVTIQNNRTTEVSVINALKPGRVQIYKTNPKGQPLQGACFDLASDGKGTQCSDASGGLVFSNLSPGTYSLTEVQAPYGYDEIAPIKSIKVQPGQTTVLRLIDKLTPPPANTGSVQVQKFICTAGDAGERTKFLSGADGTAALANTSGCTKGNAVFTLVEDSNEGGPGQFSTGNDGQYQVTVPQGLYLLTETDPDLTGDSSVRLRVYTGQLTTVIVINYVAPPAPEAATINVTKYTCGASFGGTLYEDFAQSCSTTQQLTNNITIRAQGPVNAKHVTGDGGQRGQTSFTELPPGTYTIYEDRPYNIPTDYIFCGFNGSAPSDYKAVNGKLEIKVEYGQTLTCQLFNIPEDLTADTGTILVRKYVCEVENPAKGYDWENECRLSDQSASFTIAQYNGEMKAYGEKTTGQANPDGLLRFTRLTPGEYQLLEVGSTWCHAESNSVNTRGEVVVQANKLAEVWIYNCVKPNNPPNTGSGDAAGMLNPGGEDGSAAATIALSMAWPLLAAGIWFGMRRSRRQPTRAAIKRHAA